MANLRNVPPSNLRAIKKGMTYQYYLKTSEDKQSRYLKKSERYLAENRAQLDYELNIQRVLKNQQKILKNLISRYNENSVEDTYRCLCEGRKNIVQPIQMPIEQYICEWKKSYEVNKNSIPMKVQYETVNGEMVRSKSEKIIADMLFKAGVPYIYEAELKLAKDGILYPDFIVLNVKTRKSFIWEHLGLCDLEEYASKNIKKIAKYERNGIMLGKDLIISTESEEAPLNIKVVAAKIAEYL